LLGNKKDDNKNEEGLFSKLNLGGLGSGGLFGNLGE